MSENIGNVVQIAGPAVDVQFTEAMPPIYQALRVVSDGFSVPSPINVILEVQQHLGEGRVRCVAMEATDGMVRGMKAIDQGGPISANPSTISAPSPSTRECQFTVSRPRSMNNRPQRKCSRPE